VAGRFGLRLVLNRPDIESYWPLVLMWPVGIIVMANGKQFPSQIVNIRPDIKGGILGFFDIEVANYLFESPKLEFL